MTLIKKVGTWLLSLALIFLCLVAARWQYDKGLLKSEKNREISINSSAKPVTNPKTVSFDKDQWRNFRLDGEFQENYQLLKNQYQDKLQNMARNKINDLRDHLFETLERLKDGDIDIETARAITDVSQVIINSAKIEVDFIKATGSTKDSGFMKLQEQNP